MSGRQWAERGGKHKDPAVNHGLAASDLHPVAIRSQIAFARDAWGGVLMIRIPAARKTSSKAAMMIASA